MNSANKFIPGNIIIDDRNNIYLVDTIDLEKMTLIPVLITKPILLEHVYHRDLLNTRKFKRLEFRSIEAQHLRRTAKRVVKSIESEYNKTLASTLNTEDFNIQQTKLSMSNLQEMIKSAKLERLHEIYCSRLKSLRKELKRHLWEKYKNN